MASIYCRTSTTRKLCWSKCALSPIEMCVTRAVQGEINSPKISALRKMGFWLGYSCVSFKQMRECCQTPWHRYPLLMCSAGWIFPPSIVASLIPYKPPKPLTSGLVGDFMEAAASSTRKKQSTQIIVCRTKRKFSSTTGLIHKLGSRHRHIRVIALFARCKE